MDPMSRKMAMKNVAGFHSLAFFLLAARFSLRNGFGIRDLQNVPATTVAGTVLENRMLARRIWDAVVESEVAGKLPGRVRSRRIDILLVRIVVCISKGYIATLKSRGSKTLFQKKFRARAI